MLKRFKNPYLRGSKTVTYTTVDGRNPAPVHRWFIPWFTGFLPSQVLQDFATIHSRIIWEMVTQIYPPSPTILVRPLCAHSSQLRIASKTHHEWGPCILQRWQAQVVGDAISKFGTQKLKLKKKGWNPSISWRKSSHFMEGIWENVWNSLTQRSEIEYAMPARDSRTSGTCFSWNLALSAKLWRKKM